MPFSWNLSSWWTDLCLELWHFDVGWLPLTQGGSMDYGSVCASFSGRANTASWWTSHWGSWSSPCRLRCLFNWYFGVQFLPGLSYFHHTWSLLSPWYSREIFQSMATICNQFLWFAEVQKWPDIARKKGCQRWDQRALHLVRTARSSCGSFLFASTGIIPMAPTEAHRRGAITIHEVSCSAACHSLFWQARWLEPRTSTGFSPPLRPKTRQLFASFLGKTDGLHVSPMSPHWTQVDDPHWQSKAYSADHVCSANN